MEIPAGVYYVPGGESMARDNLIHTAILTHGIVAVSFQAFGRAVDTEDDAVIAAAFRGAVNGIVELGEPVLLLDNSIWLDRADIALYGFDGPSRLVPLPEMISGKEGNGDS